jgi:beta-alanine degradation protein BauB
MSDRPSAVPTIQIDDHNVRVTQWRLAPGTATGHHRHALDYVVIPLTDGTLTLCEADETRLAPLTAGVAYARGAGVEHDAVNETEREIVFVEVELKTGRASA